MLTLNVRILNATRCFFTTDHSTFTWLSSNVRLYLLWSVIGPSLMITLFSWLLFIAVQTKTVRRISRMHSSLTMTSLNVTRNATQYKEAEDGEGTKEDEVCNLRCVATNRLKAVYTYRLLQPHSGSPGAPNSVRFGGSGHPAQPGGVWEHHGAPVTQVDKYVVDR